MPPVEKKRLLRLAMRSSRELYELEKLLPDDGRLEPSPPLVERVNELLNAKSFEHENWLTHEEQTALFDEMRADAAAAKSRERCPAGITLQELLEEKTKSPAVRKGRDRDIER